MFHGLSFTLFYQVNECQAGYMDRKMGQEVMVYGCREVKNMLNFVIKDENLSYI